MTPDTTTDDHAPKPWSMWGTFAWVALAAAVGQGAATLVLIWWRDEGLTPALRFDGPVVALGALIANPVLIAVLALAARLAGWSPARYFGLTPFRRRDLGLGIVAVAALAAAFAASAHLLGRDLVTAFQIEAYVSTPGAAWLTALFVALVIAAPLGEEIMFRGFLFRGWVSPDRNPLVPIVSITVMWTALHVQYDWFGMTQVFALGLLLGWMRWRSGSTTLVVVLHALMNLESTVETVVRVGWRM